MIPFKKVNLGNALEAIKPLIENGMIGLGNTVFEFEKELAKYLGCKYVVAVDSCTSALFLCLKWEKSAIVGIPSMTVPLVADAVYEAGKKLVFTDETEWVGSAYRLFYTNVWDSAHQLERNQCKGMGANKKVCFSFYPTKNIGSADGGAIATNDKEFAEWAKKVSTYGRNQGTKYQNSWEYEVDLIGYKRHYTNLQAAICLEQLRRLDQTNARRIKIRDKYNKAFGLDNKSLYLYRIKVENRNKFLDYMTKNGVMCGVHFQPLHLMKAFKDVPWEMGCSQELVEDAYEHTVSLPFYDTMTNKEIDYIIDLVKKL
jgi:dTDP-4-amino-4,6-dideoxygalactose transaminase